MFTASFWCDLHGFEPDPRELFLKEKKRNGLLKNRRLFQKQGHIYWCGHLGQYLKQVEQMAHKIGGVGGIQTFYRIEFLVSMRIHRQKIRVSPLVG